METLSVSISNRLSPGFTCSPADLNHFVILPSDTVSPSCGIRTSISARPTRSSLRKREGMHTSLSSRPIARQRRA